MIDFLSIFPDWLKIVVSAMIPVFELRWSIPFGILILKMSYLYTYIFSIIGTIIPAPFILWFIPSILKWMRSTKLLGGLGNWIYNKGIKNTVKVNKYGFWGLVIFIGIPLPGTGVWTGCLAASLLQLDFKKSFLASIVGAAVAGIAMMILTFLLGMAIL
ncbi:MAG: COG2426 family protein [Eubacteriales bacterium]